MEHTPIIVFVLSVTIVLYVLFGYPAFLALLARRRSKPVAKGFQRPAVSVLLPVRNGEPWIRAKLHSLLNLDYPRELIDITVISDGSSDGTDEIVGEYARDGVRLIRISRAGKAAALNAGMARARGEILFFTDVRQQLDPACLTRLVECFADSSVGVVSGELILLDGEDQAQARISLYWRYEKWIRARLSAIDSVPGATGCIYAMRRELAVPIPPGMLLDDVYLPLVAFFRGYRIIMESAAKAYDYPERLGPEFLRKVRTLTGVYQIALAFPALLLPTNRIWIHFISHKLGRLVLPHALIVMAVSSFTLPGIWRDLALVSQAIFYASSVLDGWIPENWSLKALSSGAHAFVVLVTAAFCAVPSFLFGGLDVWIENRARPSAHRAHAQVE